MTGLLSAKAGATWSAVAIGWELAVRGLNQLLDHSTEHSQRLATIVGWQLLP